MPAGLKASSSTVAIGFLVNETAANTYTQASVDLNLSPLDREVFVVQSINMDASPPDAIATVNTTHELNSLRHRKQQLQLLLTQTVLPLLALILRRQASPMVE